MPDSKSRYAPQRGRPSGPTDIGFSSLRISTQQHYSSSTQQYNAASYTRHDSSANRNPPPSSHITPSNTPPKAQQSRTQGHSTKSRAASSNNWRAKDERPPVSFDIPYNPLPEYQGLDANRSTVMTKELCCVGKIIRAVVHDQDFNDTPGCLATPDDTHTTVSKYGTIYSKMRWMIVVAVHHGNYLTVPIYTHNGTGLSNKSDAARLEYVSIRDLRHTGEFESLSKHRRLDARMKAGTTLLNRKSVAHLTAPISRKYGMLVEEQGQLDEYSVDDFTRLWRKCTFGEQ